MNAQSGNNDLGKNTTHLQLLERSLIGPTNGKSPIGKADDIFVRHRIDTRFNQLKKGLIVATPETDVGIYKVTKAGDAETLFSSFGVDVRTLCFTESQIVEFVRYNRHSLLEKRRDILFLFEAEKELFIANVFVTATSSFGVTMIRFDSDIRFDEVFYRLVVPQQTV